MTATQPEGLDMNRQHRALLIRLQVGGCTCETKTDEVKYHSTDCQYRVACEIEEALTFEDDTIPAAPAHCQCSACQTGTIHASDCAVHNAPALPVGKCDCSAAAPAQSGEPVAKWKLVPVEPTPEMILKGGIITLGMPLNERSVKCIYTAMLSVSPDTSPQPSPTAVVLDDEPVAWFYYEDGEFIRMYDSEERAEAAREKFGGDIEPVYKRSVAQPVEQTRALTEERIDWIANAHCPGGTAWPSNVKAAIRDALNEAGDRCADEIRALSSGETE